ncbi:MAG: polyhydroxyalkanoate synthesis repressor PhaR [Pseudomonadales bacterium]|jgi:polyhydroxyalkanoate synthesis repressor PhaR|nr:polyhydroxyalkanoate synthesis repressor PhaR [Pseudomonadales bacterium]
MRILKKYPNRRLYDTQQSVYVTLEDVRQMVLANESIKVVDSKSGVDLTRSVLLQIIAEQEGEGHEPLLTNRVLQQLIRFYGDSMQGVLSRYLEQSLMIFLQQQELYQRRMRDVLTASPIKMVQRFADQNIAFWRNVLVQDRARAEAGSEDAPAQAPGQLLDDLEAASDAAQQFSPEERDRDLPEDPSTAPDDRRSGSNSGA